MYWDALGGRVLAILGFCCGLLCAGPGAMAQAPQLTSVTPANGASDVPINTSLVFRFDQAMDTDVMVTPSFPPFLIGNLSVSAGSSAALYFGNWSEDGLTLTCDPVTGDLPEGTLVTWTLNPAGTSEPFVSASGTPLGTISGSFTTAGEGSTGDDDCDGLPDGWGAFSVFKGANYLQTSEADPVPEAIEPFVFGVTVAGPDAGPNVTESSLTLPDNSVLELELVPFAGLFFYSDAKDTEAELDTDYPPGNYVLRFTQEGQAQVTVPMTMPVNNVPVPKIQNFAESQSVDASADFTLRWNSFNVADDDDFLSVSLSDTDTGDVVFEAPDLCLPRELPVTATSVVIPAGTLQTDRTYAATLLFGKVYYASTNTAPEMSGFGGMSRVTNFSLRTGTGGVAGPATLSDFRVLENGDVEFQLSGTALRSYSIERTSALGANAQWAEVGSVLLDAAGQGQFLDSQTDGSVTLYYRAVTE